MCIAIAATRANLEKESEPVVMPFSTSFTEGFDPSQFKTRGAISWTTLFSTPHLSAGIASLPLDKSGTLGLHRHLQPELYYVLSGAAIIEIGGKQHRLERGMTVFVPGNAEHGVLQDVSLETDVFRWLYVFPSSFEDVVYKFRSEGAYVDNASGSLDRRTPKAKL